MSYLSKGCRSNSEVTSSHKHIITPLHTFELSRSSGQGESLSLKKHVCQTERQKGGGKADTEVELSKSNRS